MQRAPQKYAARSTGRSIGSFGSVSKLAEEREFTIRPSQSPSLRVEIAHLVLLDKTALRKTLLRKSAKINRRRSNRDHRGTLDRGKASRDELAGIESRNYPATPVRTSLTRFARLMHW